MPLIALVPILLPASAPAQLATGTAIALGVAGGAASIKAGRMVYTKIKCDSIFADEIYVGKAIWEFFTGKKTLSTKDQIFLLQINVQALTDELAEIIKNSADLAAKNDKLKLELKKVMNVSTDAVKALEENIEVLKSDLNECRIRLEQKSMEKEEYLSKFNLISEEVNKLIVELEKHKNYKKMYLNEKKECKKWKSELFQLTTYLEQIDQEETENDTFQHIEQDNLRFKQKTKSYPWDVTTSLSEYRSIGRSENVFFHNSHKKNDELHLGASNETQCGISSF